MDKNMDKNIYINLDKNIYKITSKNLGSHLKVGHMRVSSPHNENKQDSFINFA
jgi:hypothetical protein